ncbi:tyrosine/serine/threonine protein phosphatase [Coniothyrium glycines]
MVQTSARSFMPMPSFGSVFGSNQEHADLAGSHVARPASSGHTNTGAPFSSFHAHSESRDSASTASSDNSPTTTISTMDSSSVTDPSPGVSPESPLPKTATPSSFVADFRSRRTEPMLNDSLPSAFFELQRPTTPAKKPRNLKNLGINTTSSLSNLRAHTPAPIAVAPKEKTNSAPPSPLFIKPPTPPKRRPSNLSLTIATPGGTDNKPVRLIIPSTPSFNRPALRHFQSSPSLPLCSPSNNFAGGMTLPALRPLTTNRSGLSEVPFEMEEEEDQEPNFDVPQSREEKPAAYPNGPICIYEAGVYLYFEPTAEQATTFDVIINVASEVQNPFNASGTDTQKAIDARRVDGPPAENVDFTSLAQRAKPASFGKQDSSSPTTPKATPTMQVIPPREVSINGNKHMTPEYIHMPWEHNTDIVPDLYKLVKLMDERVQQGKRVLIHCQCGVSRSASLIVAYGLYKDPRMSVQEAYDKAKKRSKWIGPNMNLIMQLQEFRNGLLRQNESRSYHNQGFGRRSAGLPTARSSGATRYSPFDHETSSGSRTPRTAPLPPDCDISMQRASTGNIMGLSPGPLSAPTGAFSPGFRRSWDSSATHFGLSQPVPSSAPDVDAKAHPVPLVSLTTDNPPTVHEHIVASETNFDCEEPSSRSLPVPNFSRQLPLRSQASGTDAEPLNARELHAPSPRYGFDVLKSPAVASFNIPSRPPFDQSFESDEIMSPIKTSFDDPWRGYDLDPQPAAPGLHVPQMSFPPLRSPRVGTFDIPQLSSNHETPLKTSETGSPFATQFPKDILDGSDDALEEDLSSPRATDFHMTPLKSRVADVDPFGLTSPTRSEFASDPFDRPNIAPLHKLDTEDQRRSFQAILPPAHSTFNGFASLDGTAQAQPAFAPFIAMSGINAKTDTLIDSRVDSLSTPPQPQVQLSYESPIPNVEPLRRAPETPQSPSQSFLSTPAKTIRTRFSSPNLREQRKLHKLQTEIQSKLPRPPVAQHAADDIDALMSPRAEEFTRNPFHFELHTVDDDASPASSNETIKESRNEHDWNEPLPRKWTPEKATVDPRSPVQTGSSPITRNIWDVL